MLDHFEETQRSRCKRGWKHDCHVGSARTRPGQPMDILKSKASLGHQQQLGAQENDGLSEARRWAATFPRHSHGHRSVSVRAGRQLPAHCTHVSPIIFIHFGHTHDSLHPRCSSPMLSPPERIEIGMHVLTYPPQSSPGITAVPSIGAHRRLHRQWQTLGTRTSDVAIMRHPFRHPIHAAHR